MKNLYALVSVDLPTEEHGAPDLDFTGVQVHAVGSKADMERAAKGLLEEMLKTWGEEDGYDIDDLVPLLEQGPPYRFQHPKGGPHLIEVVPVQDVRVLRPIVTVEGGVATSEITGCGRPAVIDYDEFPGLASFAVGVDDAEIVGRADTLDEALDIALRELIKGASKVDIELNNDNLDPLEVITLYERDK